MQKRPPSIFLTFQKTCCMDLSDDDDDNDPDFLSPEDLIDDPDEDLLPLLDNPHFFLEQDDVDANTEPSDDYSVETPPFTMSPTATRNSK